MKITERDELYLKLGDLISKDCETNAQYFERLCCALQYISNCIDRFKYDFYTYEENDEIEEIDSDDEGEN